MKHRTVVFGLGICFIFGGPARADDALLDSLIQKPATPVSQQASAAPMPAAPSGPAENDPLQALAMLQQEVLGSVSSTPAPAAQEATAKEATTQIAREVIKPSIPVATQDDLTRQNIRDRVRALRQERVQSMPYLSRGIVREAIDAKRVKSRTQFASGDQKKLDDLVARAVDTHLPAKASWERISLAERRIFRAVRQLLPEANVTYEDKDGMQTDQYFNSRGFNFTLRQPLFRGGILWNTLLQERAELKAAKKEYDKITEDLVKDVSEAYFEYNRASEVVQDQQRSILKMEPFAKISEQKFKEELISEIEHLNVQSLFNQMKYDFETSKQELELAKLDLQSYLDLQIDDNVQIAPLYNMDAILEKSRGEAKAAGPDVTVEGFQEEMPESMSIPELKSLVDMAYHHRAELQVEAYKLESARLNERVRAGELLPRADLVLEMGELGEAFDDNSVHPKLRKEFRAFIEMKWNVMGSNVGYKFENDENAPSVTQFQSSSGTQTTTNTFSFDLFDGLDALVEMKQAEAEKLDQVVELENAEKEVVQDVKKAYYDYQKALIQLKSTLQKLDYRERLAQLSKHRLEQNEIQISEYFQAELDLASERTELNKALKDYFTAKAALNRAVGVRNYLPIEETYGK